MPTLRGSQTGSSAKKKLPNNSQLIRCACIPKPIEGQPAAICPIGIEISPSPEPVIVLYAGRFGSQKMVVNIETLQQLSAAIGDKLRAMMPSEEAANAQRV